MKNLYFAVIGTMIVLAGLTMSAVNYFVDGQRVFQSASVDGKYLGYARIVPGSAAGVTTPPVPQDRILKYVMMQEMKPDCVLFGSSHILPASAEEMPSIFGGCERFLNAWVTAGNLIDGAIYADLAIQQDVSMFVWEMSPRWYHREDMIARWSELKDVADAALEKAERSDSFLRSQLYGANILWEKFRVLINAAYFKQNVKLFIDSGFRLPDRGVKDDGVYKATPAPSMDARHPTVSYMRPNGQTNYSQLHVGRKSGADPKACTFPADAPTWGLFEKSLRRLKAASVDARIIFTPTHPVWFQTCPTIRGQFEAFDTRVRRIAEQYDVKVHGSLFAEELGDPEAIAALIGVDGHHLVKGAFTYIK